MKSQASTSNGTGDFKNMLKMTKIGKSKKVQEMKANMM